MKKLLTVVLTIGIIAGLSGMSFAYNYNYPDVIIVDSYLNGCPEFNNCISDPPPTSYDSNVIVVSFDSEIYEFLVLDGGFTAWNVPHGLDVSPQHWFWTVNIYNPDTGENKMLGNTTEGFDFRVYDADDALNNAQNAGNSNSAPSVTFDLRSGGTDLWFFVRDDEPRDNEGTLTVGVAIVPEPISSVLFVVGGVLFAGRSYLKRKRQTRSGTAMGRD